jgi:hypothetical protein
MIQPFEQGNKVTTIPPKSTGGKVASEKETGNRHGRLRSVKALFIKKIRLFTVDTLSHAACPIGGEFICLEKTRNPA